MKRKDTFNLVESETLLETYQSNCSENDRRLFITKSLYRAIREWNLLCSTFRYTGDRVVLNDARTYVWTDESFRNK